MVVQDIYLVHYPSLIDIFELRKLKLKSVTLRMVQKDGKLFLDNHHILEAKPQVSGSQGFSLRLCFCFI